jgi:hypothetical protein
MWLFKYGDPQAHSWTALGLVPLPLGGSSHAPASTCWPTTCTATVVHADTGEIIRDLTLDPDRDYQPVGRKPGPDKWLPQRGGRKDTLGGSVRRSV